MKEDLRQLIYLAQIDAIIDELTQKREHLPTLIRELENEITDLESSLLGTLDQIKLLEHEKSQKEIELAEQRDWLAKREIKVKEIKTNKEYHAAVKEVNEGKKRIAKLEDEILKIQASMEEKTPNLKTFEVESNGKKATLTEEISNKKAEMDAIQTNIDDETTKRQNQLTLLGETMIKRYQAIKNRLTPAMAVAQDGTCLECHTRIPPQTYIELQKFQTLITCPRCHRILYLETLA